MKTNIKTITITLSPALNDYVTKRLEKINHLFANDPSIQCDVELKRTTSHHHKGEIFQADIHVVGHKHNVYASAERSDMYTAIDEVTEEAFHSLTARHKKYIALARRGGARVKNMIKGLWPNRS